MRISELTIAECRELIATLQDRIFEMEMEEEE